MIQSGLIEGELKSGITQQAINTAIQSAESGLKTLYISIDLNQHQFLCKCIYQISGIDPYELHKGQSKDDEAKVLGALKYLKNLPITFVNVLPSDGTKDDNDIFIKNIISVCDTAVNQLDVKHIILDKVPQDVYFSLLRELKTRYMLGKNTVITLTKTGLKGTPLHFEPFNVPFNSDLSESEKNDE